MSSIFFSQGYFWQVVEGLHRPALLILTLFQSSIYKVNVREYPPRIYVVKTDNFELYDGLTWRRQPLKYRCVCVLFIVSFKRLRWVRFGVFLHHLLKFKPLDDVFPFKTWLQISLCLWLERVWVHPVNKDVSQAIFSTFYQCQFQKIVGWIGFKFSLLFMLRIKSFKMWRLMSLFKLLRFLLCVSNHSVLLLAQLIS